MRLTIINEDFKLYEVNYKGLLSSTTPPQSKTHKINLAWLKEPFFIVYLQNAYHGVLNWSIEK